MRRSLTLLCIPLSIAVSTAAADELPQYRGFWVDTFNTTLNNHADVVAVVSKAKAANANAVFAQVRRRGDSWYLDSLEGPADRTPLAPGFDPLQDLIDEAHGSGLEVHAFVIVGALWNRLPTLFPPEYANHPFNLHGYNQATRAIYTGPDNWLTRTLLPDSPPPPAPQLITFGGYRIGAEFWIDLGHPAAEAYTVDVLLHLVRRYDIDGLHLDRIRYPELSVTGQTPSTGVSIGYNETSLARYRRRYGLAADVVPAQNDARWSQWRRDQVSNVVRRIYLNAIAENPQLKLSAALIVFGGGPVTEAEWPTKAEAYWRVFQDWRAWTEEGILDVAMPMNYKAEHNATQRAQFDQWSEWTKNHAYDRSVMIGQGGLVNAIEGSLRQARRALDPSSTGKLASGVTFYSMATSNVAVNANPFSIPAGQNTPVRVFAEFAAGLKTGRSVNGLTRYEPAGSTPLFASAAAIPEMPWKTQPVVGHLMGFVRDEAGHVVDAGDVHVERVEADPAAAGRTAVQGATDGGGFYGAVDLAPGRYRVTVGPTGADSWTSGCTAEVAAGRVATFDLDIDREPPTLTIAADPSQLWPPNGEARAITITGHALDTGTGVDRVEFRVADEYGLVEPPVAAVAGNGQATVDWTLGIELEASRDGGDRDGRAYTIEATAADRACQSTTARTTVIVPHDRRR
jgi:uncharacterized lipoprotein YddW (UPF0748 family)